MIMNTGKGINDLGNVDACEMNELVHYGVMKVVIDAAQPVNIFLGICIPK